MAKKNKSDVEVSFNGKIIDFEALKGIVDRKEYEIIGASIKDAFCNYNVKILSGQMQGEKSKHDGPLIVTDDLRKSFEKLHKHLAVLDDAFENQDYELHELEGNIKVGKYHVDSFIIRGADENIQVKLIGSKYLSAVSGRMECKTPYILLDAGTDYKWYNELIDEIKACQREVALYKEGKGIHPEKPEKKKSKQTKITDDDLVEETEEGKVF